MCKTNNILNITVLVRVRLVAVLQSKLAHNIAFIFIYCLRSCSHGFSFVISFVSSSNGLQFKISSIIQTDKQN